MKHLIPYRDWTPEAGSEHESFLSELLQGFLTLSLSFCLFPLVLYILPQLTSPWLLFLFNCNSSLDPYQLYKRRNQDEEARQCNRSAIVNLNLCIWDLDHINAMLRSTRSEAVIFTVSPQHRAKMSLQCSMSWLWKIFPKVWNRWVMGMNAGNEKLLTNMD